MEKWNNTGENYRLHIRISIWGFFGNIGSHHLWKSAENWQDWNGRSPHLAKKLRPKICVKKVGALIWWCGTHMGWWCLRHLWTYVWNRFSCACRVLIGYHLQDFQRPFLPEWHLRLEGGCKALSGWFWNPAKPGESLKAWLGNSAHGGPT